jgi:mannose-6-phosphate isomerase-like protein (cupin superfamily)
VFGRCISAIGSAYNNHMNEEALAGQLRREGFRHTHVWEDGPSGHYPDHTHPTETAHIILSGEMTLTTPAGSTVYRAGDRCNVPAGAVHSARMGARGCRYLIGER